MERDSKVNHVVLSTTHPDYFSVVLFKTCGDFKKFLNSLVGDSPELKTKIYNELKKVPNPTCPNVLD